MWIRSGGVQSSNKMTLKKCPEVQLGATITHRTSVIKETQAVMCTWLNTHVQTKLGKNIQKHEFGSQIRILDKLSIFHTSLKLHTPEAIYTCIFNKHST